MKDWDVGANKRPHFHTRQVSDVKSGVGVKNSNVGSPNQEEMAVFPNTKSAFYTHGSKHRPASVVRVERAHESGSPALLSLSIHEQQNENEKRI